MARLPNFLPKYFRRTKGILMRRGTRPEDAEDLIQDAFIKMQQYCAKGGAVHQPEGFLVRTALRLAANAHRDAHGDLYVDKKVDELALLIDTSPTPDEVFAADECLMRMRTALDGVNARSREVFFMHRFDGLTQPDIALRFGISVSAVEKHIAIALAALAEASLRE
jgi:RNA polymerase sigma-70 factor (ECF subfamily)